MTLTGVAALNSLPAGRTQPFRPARVHVLSHTDCPAAAWCRVWLFLRSCGSLALEEAVAGLWQGCGRAVAVGGCGSGGLWLPGGFAPVSPVLWFRERCGFVKKVCGVVTAACGGLCKHAKRLCKFGIRVISSDVACDRFYGIIQKQRIYQQRIYQQRIYQQRIHQKSECRRILRVVREAVACDDIRLTDVPMFGTKKIDNRGD